MRFPLVLAMFAALVSAGTARANGSGPFGITGVNLTHAGGIAAAAFRHDGKQVVTVNFEATGLLFWDAASGRLLDTMLFDGVSAPPGDTGASHATLTISRDGAWAAVTVRPATLATTRLIDLVAQKTVATLDRPALFWMAAGLVAGPHAGCTAACDFAVVDPATARQTPVGTGFGDARIVAATVDGGRFATVVGDGPAQSLVVWATATWAPIARAALAADPPVEIGFDAKETRAFARQDGQVVTVRLDGGPGTRMVLAPGANGGGMATDIDRREVVTAAGLVPFDSQLLRRSLGRFNFYASDPRYGAIYDYNDGAAAAIGALPAAPNAFPWQVELQYRAPPGSPLTPEVLHNCGGSLIRPGWVLTATHCFLTADNVLRSDDEARAHTVVRAGSVNLNGPMTSFDVIEVHIRRCAGVATDACFHDSDPAGQPPAPPLNDITLLRIMPRVEAAPERSYARRPSPPGKIKPIRLPAGGAEIAPPAPVTMTGWGATSAINAQERVMSAILNRIDIAVMPRETCRTRHGFGPLSPSLLCAGSADDQQLACRGDSGGPLVADIDKRPVLVGIVSWGSCTGGPAVYTNVAAFIPWINATIAAAEARR